MIPKSMSSTRIGDGYRFSEKIMPTQVSSVLPKLWLAGAGALDCRKHSLGRKRLCEERGAFQRACGAPEGVVRRAGHEDDRNRIPEVAQLAHQLDARDVAKLDIDDKAVRLADVCGGEEFLRGQIGFDGKPGRAKQVDHGVAHDLAVVNDGDGGFGHDLPALPMNKPGAHFGPALARR